MRWLNVLLVFGMMAFLRTDSYRQLPVSIQQMIDNAVANDDKHLVVPAGTYDVYETINGAYNLSLDLSGVVLVARNDVDIFRVAHRGHINGGTIDASNVVFTHSALVVDGETRFDMTFPTFISNMQILGNWQTDGATGIGIKMESIQGGENHFVFGVHFTNIGVSYMQYGLLIRSIANGGSFMACVNGNTFSNMTFAQSRNPIYLESVDWLVSADGNTFSNIQIQSGIGATRAIYVEGDFNLFRDVMVWDWSTPPAIEFNEESAYNQLNTTLFPTQVRSDGWNNLIVTTEP